jgi:hypothetical protein
MANNIRSSVDMNRFPPDHGLPEAAGGPHKETLFEGIEKRLVMRQAASKNTFAQEDEPWPGSQQKQKTNHFWDLGG